MVAIPLTGRCLHSICRRRQRAAFNAEDTFPSNVVSEKPSPHCFPSSGAVLPRVIASCSAEWMGACPCHLFKARARLWTSRTTRPCYRPSNMAGGGKNSVWFVVFALPSIWKWVWLPRPRDSCVLRLPSLSDGPLKLIATLDSGAKSFAEPRKGSIRLGLFVFVFVDVRHKKMCCLPVLKFDVVYWPSNTTINLRNKATDRTRWWGGEYLVIC